MKNVRRGMGLGKGSGYYNLAPMDSHIHSLSAKGVKTLIKNKNLYAKGKIKDLGLSYQVVDGKARMFDFSQGYGDTWEIAVDQTDEEMENEEYVPMMNYLYPLPDDFDVPTDIKKKLNNMTVVYLTEEEKYYLALTGGGMDMSWQICETYVNLGLYPPADYCDLPAMAGKDYKSAKNRKIIEACKNSYNAQSMRGSYGVERLERLGD